MEQPVEIEHFLHAQGAAPKAVKGLAGETLREVLVRVEVIEKDADGLHVFIGEWDEALREPHEVEDGEDTHCPADLDLTLEVLELHRHRHVHCHRCRHVGVEVHFGGQTKRHRFSPAATVEVATEWARRKFRLDPSSAAEYVLQLCNSSEQPRGDVHLGELVKAPNCGLCFDLVKEVTPQG